jgi:hypothetical protein
VLLSAALEAMRSGKKRLVPSNELNAYISLVVQRALTRKIGPV